MNDQASTLRALAEAGMYGAYTIDSDEVRLKNVGSACTSIAVTSGKGGVGKTAIALSLAIALARMKKKVLLVDGDLGLANVHLLLGVAPRVNISHVVRGTCSIEEIVWEGPMGVHILPGACGIEEMANLDSTSLERINAYLTTFERQYDFLIIDTAAGIGASVTRFAAATDYTLLILTPEPASLADAYATAKVLFERGAHRIAALVNMAVSGREGAETFDRLNTLVVRFLERRLLTCGTVLYEKAVPRSMRKQRLILFDFPDSRFSEKMQSVAWKISGMPIVEHGGFFKRLWKCVA
jgi:flagellar biosynthesis protein FlhG